MKKSTFFVKKGTCCLVCLLMLINVSIAGDKVYEIQCDNTPPYTLIDKHTGFVTGIWTETLRSVMKRLKEPHDIQMFSWARVQENGFLGVIDGVFGAQINEERQKYMRFPKETLSTEVWLFWIRKNSLGQLRYTSFADLKGKSIGLVRGYNYPKEFMDFVRRNAEVQEVATETQNFKKLALGRIDYTVSLLHIGSWISGKEGLSDKLIPLVNKPLFKSKFYVMFNKEKVSQDWVNQFSDELAKYKKTPEFRDLPKRFGLVE